MDCLAHFQPVVSFQPLLCEGEIERPRFKDEADVFEGGGSGEIIYFTDSDVFPCNPVVVRIVRGFLVGSSLPSKYLK